MMLTSTQIGELAAQFFIAGAGTLSFAILFGCPRKSLPFCGLVGAVGWFVYELAVLLGMDAAAASLLAVIPPLLFSQPWSVWVQRALVFLVVSCPCALVVSVPLTFFGGIGGASRCGILIKGAGYMETLAKARTVVFDKTGTLTKGSFTVTHIVPQKGSKDDLLALAAAAESFSRHPIAQSVVAAYGKPIEAEPEDAKDHTGRGIEAVIGGRHIFAGNERLMNEIGVPCAKVNEIGTVIHMAADREYLV